MKRVLPAVLLLATAATLPGPTKAEFTAAVQAMVPEPGLKIRRLKCQPIAEEPSEYACNFDKRVGQAWQKWSTFVATDRNGWHLIDAPGPAAN